MSALASKVAETITRYSMFTPEARIGVAVSGGADSVALLHLLHGLQPWDLALTVLHLNHCLRGADSDAEEQFVRSLAHELGLPVVCHRQDIAALGGNLEESARDARLAFFRTTARDHRLDCIALGHTRSDQAETVLFRLLRGAYTTGLAGIRPVTAEGIVRPLLFIEHAELEDYLRARGAHWREDASNRDDRFARNRIRHQLLPQLAADWNPRFREILANHAVLAQEDESYWDSQVSEALAGSVEARGDTRIADLSRLGHLPRALLRRVFRRLILSQKGDLRQVDFRHIEQVMQLVESSEGHGRLQIPGVDVMRSFHWLRFGPPPAGPAERNFSIPVTPPAAVPLPGSESEITFQVTAPYPPGFAHDTIDLDWDRVRSAHAGGLEVRNWQPGDRYQRAGHSQEEKVKTLFHEARVPLWDRRNWPIVCFANTILWTRQFGPDIRYAASAASVRVLRISERKRI